MQKYFSLNSFSFSFDRKSNYFFHNINIAITKPGITFIVGKNGVGKSTFIRLLQGIVHQSELIQGVLELKDQRYNLEKTKDCDKLYTRSIILHQSFDTMLAPSFTGFENLSFARFDKNPGLSQVVVSSQVSHFIQKFNIPLEKPVHMLSGGQRQMLAMLMVTQNSVDVLLFDEPTAALDDKNSDYVMQGILDVALEKNLVVFCIVHDMNIVEKHATNIITIAQTDTGIRTISLKEIH